MDISVSGAYIYFTIPIFGGIAVTQTMLSLILVTAFLCIVGVLLGRNLKKRPGKMQVLTEKGVSILQNMVVETMGAHNVGWTPFIGTIFLSSLCGSLIGLTGFFRSTTADLAVPLTWAVMVSVLIWYNSIKRNGFLGWLKGFTEPVVVMTPMNIISEIAQPVAMAFRHFGNVAGGGIISSVVYTAMGLASSFLLQILTGTVVMPILLAVAGIAVLLIGLKKKKTFLKILGIAFAVIALVGILHYTGILTDIPILQFGLPAVLSVYFDLFSGLIQAYVFSLLSMVYISGACPPPAKQEA